MSKRGGRITIKPDGTYLLLEDYQLYAQGKNNEPVLLGKLPLPVDFDQQTQLNDIYVDRAGRLWLATQAGSNAI